MTHSWLNLYLQISRLRLNSGNMRPKTKSQGQIFIEKKCNSIEVTFMCQSWWKLICLFILIISRSSMNLGPKTRSQGKVSTIVFSSNSAKGFRAILSFVYFWKMWKNEMNRIPGKCWALISLFAWYKNLSQGLWFKFSNPCWKLIGIQH